MRALIMSAALVFAARAGSLSAQDPLSAAKKAAQNAKAKADAHTEAMQRPEGPQAKTTAKTPAPAPQTTAAPPQSKTAAPQTKAGAASKTATKGAAKGAAAKTAADSAAPAADTVGPPPSILREVFDYAADGRRDPFVSLLTTAELRPTISDLRLTSIIYDNSGRNSLATMRDLATNTRYTVKVGSTLGRMRVSAIRPLTVLLTIDEFGTTRQDSLILRDSTKVRRP